jgi:hypothetical protein
LAAAAFGLRPMGYCALLLLEEGLLTVNRRKHSVTSIKPVLCSAQASIRPNRLVLLHTNPDSNTQISCSDETALPAPMNVCDSLPKAASRALQSTKLWRGQKPPACCRGTEVRGIRLHCKHNQRLYGVDCQKLLSKPLRWIVGPSAEGTDACRSTQPCWGC